MARIARSSCTTVLTQKCRVMMHNLMSAIKTGEGSFEDASRECAQPSLNARTSATSTKHQNEIMGLKIRKSQLMSLNCVHVCYKLLDSSNICLLHLRLSNSVPQQSSYCGSLM